MSHFISPKATAHAEPEDGFRHNKWDSKLTERKQKHLFFSDFLWFVSDLCYLWQLTQLWCPLTCRRGLDNMFRVLWSNLIDRKPRLLSGHPEDFPSICLVLWESNKLVLTFLISAKQFHFLLAIWTEIHIDLHYVVIGKYNKTVCADMYLINWLPGVIFPKTKLVA